MAAMIATINVMLAIHGKKTTPVDFYKPLRQYIARCFSEREAVDAEEDLQAVQQMRTEIEKATDALEARRDLLEQYFGALSVMESRFPISSEKEHVNSVYFTWYDAFKPAKKATQQNIHLEKAAIAFNLGAVHSQIALGADRSSPSGLKQACNCFQLAAGAFAFLRDNISMKASGNSSTIDISVECAGMLERLMLAQAQECFFEKVLIDSKPSALCAKVAQQVGLYYEEAFAALTLPPLSQHFDRAWIAHVQCKAAQFRAEACFRVSLDLHEKENIAEEIARLKAAEIMLSEAKKSGKGVVGPLFDAVSKLEASVKRNLDRAIRENDRVYLMRIPSVDSLPSLPAASLVKSASMGDILDASSARMFSGLVPDSSAKALSKYTEMLDEIIRVQVEKLQQESEITRVKLKEMNLPDSLVALDGNACLPKHLSDDVEAVQIAGGPAGFEADIRRLRDLRRANEELLVQAQEILEKEAREDAEVRTQFGTRWTRPQSSTLTKNLRDRLHGFATNLKQAQESDARIERNIRESTPLMAILDSRPLEAALPTLGRPILSLNGNEDAIVGTLRQKLGELEVLGSQRAGLEDVLKDMKRKDNILPKLMVTSGSYEDLFKKELAKYNPVCEEVAHNIEAQERLLQQIKAANDAFAKTFNLYDYIASCEKTYKQISIAVNKYREIQENINEGLKFYSTLQDAVSTLKQQCGDYAMTRNIQSRDMMEDLQRQVTGMSLNDRSSGRPYTSAIHPMQSPVPAVPPNVQRQESAAVHHPSPYGAPSSYTQYYQPNPPTPFVAPASQMVSQTPQPQASSTYTGRQQAPAHAPQQTYVQAPSQSFPRPPYYAQQGPTLPASQPHDYSQPPYPGWQAPITMHLSAEEVNKILHNIILVDTPHLPKADITSNKDESNSLQLLHFLTSLMI